MKKFNYKWSLSQANFSQDKGKVFSCFAGGGGSSMGYKLVGFDVIGCNEIDPRMMSCYVENLNPKYAYCEPIQTFKLRDDLPAELYNLDILDGSPPCSSFSMLGNRDADWGKARKFKEGQAKQVLDTLFFDFIDLAAKLQPKIVVAENVKGILMGNARKYAAKIIKSFDKAGYIVDWYLLNAIAMGVPQSRQRVFFIAVRKDLANKHRLTSGMLCNELSLELNFNQKPIPYSKIMQDVTKFNVVAISPKERALLDIAKPGCSLNTVHPKGHFFTWYYLSENEPLPCIVTKSHEMVIVPSGKRKVHIEELITACTFPQDYKFGEFKQPCHLLGMSVPPVMIANIAQEIYNQWQPLFNQ